MGFHRVPAIAQPVATGGDSSADSCLPVLIRRARGPRLLLDSGDSGIHHAGGGEGVGFAKSILVSSRKQK